MTCARRCAASRRASFSEIIQRRRGSIGELTRKWDTRFFVLQEKVLLYFKSEEDWKAMM